MARKKKSRGPVKVNDEEVDLDRFAGSSDEEEPPVDPSGHGADNEDNGEALEEEEESLSGKEDHALVPNDDDENPSDEDDDGLETGKMLRSDDVIDPSAKMANAMARILGTSSTKSSVVLSKTTTPLQRLQKEEKEARKVLIAKRQMKKERNLTSLHIPLSVATTFTVEGGGRAIAKELEQERFHRRVATRGVVALFNAISNHQKSSEEEAERKRKGERTKLTKHGFLDKIKNTAAAAASSSPQLADAKKKDEHKGGTKWNALQDDYLMDPKKNWDQDSSGDENSVVDDTPESKTIENKIDQGRRKKRRTDAKE